MYYFEIIDILKREKEELSSFEIYLFLSQAQPTNYKNVLKVLTKMYMRCNEVDRKEVKDKTGRKYVYFYRF